MKQITTLQLTKNSLRRHRGHGWLGWVNILFFRWFGLRLLIEVTEVLDDAGVFVRPGPGNLLLATSKELFGYWTTDFGPSVRSPSVRIVG